MAVVNITRDPFARATLERCTRANLHNVRNEECRECGQPGRFAYRWNPDSIANRAPSFVGMFCGIECYRAYVG